MAQRTISVIRYAPAAAPPSRSSTRRMSTHPSSVMHWKMVTMAAPMLSKLTVP